MQNQLGDTSMRLGALLLDYQHFDFFEPTDKFYEEEITLMMRGVRG